MICDQQSDSGHIKKLKWRKMKNNDKDIFLVEDFLRNSEDLYTNACSRYLLRDPSNDPVWILSCEKNMIKALIIKSKSTFIPVFSGIADIIEKMPSPKFITVFFKSKKIYSIQGLKEEVVILENTMRHNGRKISQTFDYDLMKLDMNNKCQTNDNVSGLILRVPGLSDLDGLAPLQSAYEHEEVLHKGSVFSPAASRINLSKIIVGGKILIAELNGRLAGKINISGVSFTRYMIGGVYVHPDFRGRRIASVMTAKFIDLLNGFGADKPKEITLFVKKTNIAARKLYSGLGFKVQGDYRIVYFAD
ncbi:MAG: GNAT family N-acetyltransferase [Treponema sp.]|nr:GNAT family N-acetyltransferase [Treponema sp.]